MALATTTLTTALTGVAALAETSIVVASATSVAAGRIVQIDGERMKVAKSYVAGSTTVPVLRGQEGTFPDIHAASQNVIHGDPADFADNTPQATTPRPMVATYVVDSYSAAGAILFGAAQVTTAIIIETSTLAMTLAIPDKSMDGQILNIAGNGKSQSTITTTTAGFNNAGASYDVLTLQNAGNVWVSLMALNGFWTIQTSAGITGTVTALTAAIA